MIPVTTGGWWITSTMTISRPSLKQGFWVVSVALHFFGCCSQAHENPLRPSRDIFLVPCTRAQSQPFAESCSIVAWISIYTYLPTPFFFCYRPIWPHRCLSRLKAKFLVGGNACESVPSFKTRCSSA